MEEIAKAAQRLGHEMHRRLVEIAIGSGLTLEEAEVLIAESVGEIRVAGVRVADMVAAEDERRRA
jgi:hypothetical protein